MEGYPSNPLNNTLMAYRNKIICNPKTGQTIKFLQTAQETGGQFILMETVFSPGSKEPPAHYHPHQSEKFTIFKGELTVRINGELRVYAPGQSLHVPKNTVHSMWNRSGSTTTVQWQVNPAMDTENFFEILMGLAADGKTNEDGMPGILQSALIANKYDNIFRLAGPSFILQKIIFSILTPFAYLAGYKPSYSKYLN